MESGRARNRLAPRLSTERAEAEKDRCPALTSALDSASRITRLTNWGWASEVRGGQKSEVGGRCCSDGALSPCLNRCASANRGDYSDSDIRDIRVTRQVVALTQRDPRLLTCLLVELVLKIAFPTFRQCLDFDRPAQRFYIVSLKSIKTSDIGHADLLLRS